MKIYTQQQNAWCSSPVALIQFRNSSKEEKLQYLHSVEEDLDMTCQGWISVGKVSLQYHIEDDLSVTAAALSVIQKTESTIRAEAQNQLTLLATVRQNLLAIEAPQLSPPF